MDLDAELIKQLKRAITAICDGDDKQAVQLIDSVIAQLDIPDDFISGEDNIKLLDT